MFLMDKVAHQGAPAAEMRAAPPAMLAPAFGFTFPDLYDHAALARLDAVFLDFVDKADPELQGRVTEARDALTRLTAEPR